MFSLDVFEPGLSWWAIAAGLFMHNILVLALAAVLYFSWKREWIAGTAFILFGLWYTIRTIITALTTSIDASQSTAANIAMALSWSMIIALPALLVGILFFMNWFKKKK
jgi:prolipoprotein diacylglyceryltransferase